MSNWIFYKIKDIAQVVNGSTPSTKEKDYYNGEIVWITPNDLSKQQKKYIFQGERNITMKGYQSCSTTLVPKGSILLSSRAPIGLLSIAGRELCTNQGFKNLVLDKSKINSDFLFYYLSNRVKEIESLGTGTTFKELSKSAIENYKIFIPKEISLQKNIADVLSSFDSKINLNNEAIKEFETILYLLYYYWFVQFDFPNEEGKPYKSSGGKMVWNEKLKKAIPTGWTVDKISSLIEQNKGGDWGKDESTGNYTKKVSCIRGADINYIKGNDTNSDLPERYILEKNSHKLLSANDIVIEISGGSPTQSTGRVAMITEKTIERFDNPLICSNFCQAITLKDPNLVGYFFYMWSMFYDQNIFFNYEGKTSGIKNFLFDSFVANEWYIPSQSIVHKFQQIIDSIYKKKESLLLQNKHLTACRDWLLPLLMSGQVKVKPQIEESVLNIAAEPVAEYGKQVRTIPVDAHILGGHIVNRLHKTRGMGRTKLQKALHLVEYHCQMELNSQSMQFAAGPHDQEMMNYIDQKFFQFQHVKKEKEYINGKTHYKYIPTNRIQEIECAYENIDCNKRKEIDNLLDKIATMDLARAEIVSTLYAVWNNRLIINQTITDDYLLQDFYEWSKHKHDFPRELVLKALNYMQKENIVPVGWGKYIDKRE
jgi:type I restriction enzyme S subunit